MAKMKTQVKMSMLTLHFLPTPLKQAQETM